MAGIIRTLAELNFDGWVAVELDSHPNPKGAAQTSAAFLEARMRELGVTKAAA